MDQDTQELLTEKDNKQRILQSISNFILLVTELKGFRGHDNVEFVMTHIKDAIKSEQELTVDWERANPILTKIRDAEDNRKQVYLEGMAGNIIRNCWRN